MDIVKKFILLFVFIVSLVSCSKEIIQHKVSVDSSPTNGGVISPPNNSYEHGQVVSLLATPKSEYLFKEWRGSLSGTSNPIPLTVDSDKQITGVFEKRSYPLVLSIVGSGTVKEEVIAVASQSQYPSGTFVKLTPLPIDGWIFKGWEGDLTSNENPLTLQISKAVTLKAIFEINIPLLSISNLTKGNIEIFNERSGQTLKFKGDVNQQFQFGDKVRIKAVNSSNSFFLSWNGSIQSNSPEIAFTLDKDYRFTIDFIDNPYSVSNMKYLMRYLYSKEIKGKPLVIKNLQIPYFNWSISSINIDQDLDYLSTDNFVVWWDKRYNHTDYAIDILRWSEFAAQRLIENGFFKPNEFDEHKLNIFIVRDNAFGVDVFPENMGQASHYAINGGPSVITYPFYNNFTSLNNVNIPTMDIIHETTHAFQVNRTSNIDFSWYTESTAEYIQSLYVADLRFGTLRHIPQMLMSSYLRPWETYRSDGVQHLYGMHILLHYLDWEGIIDQKWIGASFNKMPSNQSPFEYLVKNISNFKNIYLDFAMHATVIDFKKWSDKILLEKSNLLKQSSWTWGDTSNWLILKDSGTSGQFKSPEKVNEAWSFTSVKIENSQLSTYRIDFKSEQSFYRLGLVISTGGKNTYREISSNETFSIPGNSNAFIVAVNMPNEFSGQNKFPYQIKIDKL